MYIHTYIYLHIYMYIYIYIRIFTYSSPRSAPYIHMTDSTEIATPPKIYQVHKLKFPCTNSN